MSATEDDKVIGIVHHLGAEPCALPGDPPVLQKAVHVERGEQRRNNPALRGSPCAPPAARHAPLAIPVGLLDRCLEPQFDQAQDVAIDDPARSRLHQFRMGNRIEVLGQIRVNHVRVAATEKLVDRLDGIARRAFRSVAIGTGLEIGLEDRFDHELDGALHHPVPDRRDAERSFAAAGLWDHRPPHRLRSVRLGAKVVLIPDSHPSSPIASISSKLCPSTPGAPLLDRASR